MAQAEAQKNEGSIYELLMESGCWIKIKKKESECVQFSTACNSTDSCVVLLFFVIVPKDFKILIIFFQNTD